VPGVSWTPSSKAHSCLIDAIKWLREADGSIRQVQEAQAALHAAELRLWQLLDFLRTYDA
jgi:hypothetical protein